MKVRLEWKPEDCWIGAFWRVGPLVTFDSPWGGGRGMRSVDLWICLVPMLPIHFRWFRDEAVPAAGPGAAGEGTS